MKLRLKIISHTSILASCILLASCLVNDANSPEPEDFFVKYYGGAGTESIVDLAYLPDSDEYLIFGNSNSNDNLGAGLNDYFLVKTGIDGSVDRALFPDFSAGVDSANEEASSMKVANGHIQVIGTSEQLSDNLGVFENKKAFYLLYDMDLNETGRGIIQMDGQDVTGNDIVATSDGNYVILSTVGDAFSGERDLMYTKIAADGSVIWQRNRSLPGDDVGVSIIELSNGNLAICAQTERVSVKGFRGTNVLYLVLNPLGFINNSLSYGTTSATTNIIDDTPTKMVNDGSGAVIVGSSNVNDKEVPFILQLTSVGAIDDIRSIEFEDQPQGVRFYDVFRALNGDYLIAGDYVNFSNSDSEQGIIAQRQEALFLRTDQLGGEIVAENNFGDNFDESGRAIIQLPDGKILLGATVSFGGNNSKIGLLKLSKNGQLLE